jgi:hypothetical protein
MDRRAKRIPKPENSVYYFSMFWRVRYPWIQADPLCRFSRLNMANIRKAIATDAEAKRILEGLSPALRTQLAALIVDTRTDLAIFLGKNAIVLSPKDINCLMQMFGFTGTETFGPAGNYLQSPPECTHIIQPQKQLSLNTVKLFWFFHYGCKLTEAEAEIRTALVRNKFWSEWVSSIPVLLEYNGTESKGCESVRHAVGRFRR